MHAVETLIQRHEDQQRTSANASETLNRFLVDFHAGEHMVCYDALQEGSLIPRLRQARAVVQEALANPFVKQHLADGLAAHRQLEAGDAYAQAERMLQELERGLAAIPNKQRLIDGRMADFSRLSSQRHHYQTQIRGRRPEQVKGYLAATDRAHAGQSFADLARLPGMELLSPEVEFLFGHDALARPRRAKIPVALGVAAPPAADDIFAAQDLIRRVNLNVVTPQRAGRFIAAHLPNPGSVVHSDNLQLHTEDDLLDLLAVLAFDRASGETPHRPIRWQVNPARREHGLEPDKLRSDALAGHRVEHFTLERIA